MNKDHIIAEIQRTAKENGGVVLGWRRFEAETGIGHYDWYGQFWVRWGDAVREAGLEPSRMSKAYDDVFLLEKLVLLTRHLQRAPIQGDIVLAPKSDPTFPSEKVFRRLGPKRQRVSRVLDFCEANPGHDDVAALWKQVIVAEQPPDPDEDDKAVPTVGYVYLLKHGSRREYKIGRTYNMELSIRLVVVSVPANCRIWKNPSRDQSFVTKFSLVKFRLLASHGTPCRRSRTLHRCDTGRVCRSGDRKRGRRRAF
jgi:hypothetical protein